MQADSHTDGEDILTATAMVRVVGSLDIVDAQDTLSASLELTAEPTITTLPSVSVSPTAAWGFRRMVAGYTGNLFRLVRASDSATLDIAQDATGGPDLTGYAAWVGASSSRVDTVYDQVGANHLTQPTASNRPWFNPLDAYRGVHGATWDASASHWLIIPSTLTGDGRATTVFDVAHSGSSNSGSGFAQLGSPWNGAGSRVVQAGSGPNPRIQLINTEFQSSAQVFARSQPNVMSVAYGATTDLLRVNRAGASVPAGSAGTWTGGLVGRVSVPYSFGGQWFAKAIYPATLNLADVEAVENALVSMFSILTDPDFRLVMSGNSIVQGTMSIRSLHNAPRQADAYFNGRADVVNAGVFGQFASVAYDARARYAELYSPTLRSFVVCPEPSNDIPSSANAYTAVVATITGDLTNAANTILNVSSTTNLSNGQYVTGTGIPAGTTITNISGTTITMSANATATSTGSSVVVKAAITANRTSGSNVLTGVNNFAAVANGLLVSGTGIPTQTTITSFDSGAGTITMSANATSTGTAGAVVLSDPTLIAARALALWSGAKSTKLFFDAMIAAGYAAADILIPTTLARNWTTGENGSRYDQQEAVRLAYNALVRSEQATYGYTVLDYANIPALLNASGPQFNDGVHPGSANFTSGLEVTGNGYGYMAKLLSDTINARL